jgi:ATP-dependent Lon protease
MFGKKDIFAQEEEIEILPVFSIDAEEEEEMQQEEYEEILPVLALKNMVLFPGVVIPVTIGRPKSVEAVNEAYSNDKYVAVLTQRSIETQDPSSDDLYEVGVVARIIRLIKMPDGNSTAILQGRRRFHLDELIQESPMLKAKISVLSDNPIEDQIKFNALSSAIKDLGEQIVDLSPQLPKDASMVLKNIRNSAFLINFVASNLSVEVAGKQEIIESNDVLERAELVLKHMHNEMQILELKGKIENRVKNDMEKQQRDYILNQQMRMIQEELGESPQQEEIDEIKAKAETKKWPKAAKDKFDRDFRKLQRMNPMVPEHSITLNYLELLTDLPWEEFTEDNFDLNLAEDILNEDHFGLDKVKDRILEYLAVLKLRKDMKAPILCLVGPPGVGKTSLGKSVARALGREYIRMSLGGLHDESELRGHRKTYIGAMPGRLLQSMKKAGASNPVFILDEIDKIGNSFRGDPSSALLEILDPEQNSTFYDNYLELEYDLSKVLFIATSNSLSTIQPALLDRMELIEVSGYSVEEKLEIAKRHLIPKQLEEHGLTAAHFSIQEDALLAVVRDYTRESGVRSLERFIARLMRHVAKKIAKNEAEKVEIIAEKLEEILGPKRVITDMYEEEQGPGVAVGLAWTQVGGDILFIEASLSKGKGKLTLTGNLGDVMKESASTALSYLRAHAEELNIPIERFSETDVHIHVPAGAIPKDGPSAGITMLSALASAFSNRPLNPYLAMTGEITLRGRVLRVGGIKEKILAAKRAGIQNLILCVDNKQDVDEINAEYLEGLNFHYVRQMNEVLELALSPKA